jgi:hypothetical protein
MLITCPVLTLPVLCQQAKPEVLVLDVKELEHSQHTAAVLDRAMRTRDMDNERFLRKVRARLDACVFLLESHILVAGRHEPACCHSCFGCFTMYDATGHWFATLPVFAEWTGLVVYHTADTAACCSHMDCAENLTI